jgi:hypothetical protein
MGRKVNGKYFSEVEYAGHLAGLVGWLLVDYVGWTWLLAILVGWAGWLIV